MSKTMTMNKPVPGSSDMSAVVGRLRASRLRADARRKMQKDMDGAPTGTPVTPRLATVAKLIRSKQDGTFVPQPGSIPWIPWEVYRRNG